MSAPSTTSSQRVVPQPVASPLTRSAIFLVLKVNPGIEHRDSIRAFCPELPAIFRAVEFRNMEDGLTCVMGFGSDIWDQLFGNPRPAELHPFKEIRAGARHA